MVEPESGLVKSAVHFFFLVRDKLMSDMPSCCMFSHLPDFGVQSSPLLVVHSPGCLIKPGSCSCSQGMASFVACYASSLSHSCQQKYNCSRITAISRWLLEWLEVKCKFRMVEGDKAPAGCFLLDTIFFTCGTYFVQRSGQEHKALWFCPSQIELKDEGCSSGKQKMPLKTTRGV